MLFEKMIAKTVLLSHSLFMGNTIISFSAILFGKREGLFWTRNK